MEKRADRFERKMMIPFNLSLQEVETLISIHPAFFTELYSLRQINNIYFDSFNLSSYYQNIDGDANKRKVRIRWYGELFGDVKQPTLEVKIKNGEVGSKLMHPMPPFHFGKSFNILDYRNKLEDQDNHLFQELSSLNPVLVNSYQRKYFQSMDKNFRITIDWNIRFFKIDNSNNLFLFENIDPNYRVLEIKYDREFDQYASGLINHFPFRISKSSKYISGLINFYSEILDF